MRSYGVAIGQQSEEASTDLYQIAPILQAGANQIIISSRPGSHATSGLFVDGFVINHGEPHIFGGNSGWTVSLSTPRGNDQGSEHFGAITLSESEPLPPKQVLEIVLPLAYTVHRAKTSAL